ncbi:hypothetical protein [Sagittula salina]|uniref:RNA polymerase sigma-54 factor n=1 Tax=Sagittula salina TaxID=2820268 RepID=A0A940S2C3_9RHOB|nr:hypothetical protein [Sagittula salina]
MVLTVVRNMLARLSRLNPAPGRQYDCDPVQPALPEVLVAEAPEGGFSVTLNDALLPRALVDRAYHARIRAEATEPDTRAFITERVKHASWIVRTLDRRAVTILKVARAIVTYQRDYFHHGVDHLRPLSLQRVAETVGVNQSTVSRAIADKYLMGPRGLVALKYFFPEAVGKSDVEAVSNEAVRHRIRKLVEAEAPASVLSDDAIVRALAEENIDLARRTVAKYRAQMGIPSSAQRQRIRRAALPA